MNSMGSRRKKSRSSKARSPASCKPPRHPVRRSSRTGTRSRPFLRAEYLSWRSSLPTALERDTLLMPDAIADSVVCEAERFLRSSLPAGFAGRLAAKAFHLYPRHKHFRKMLNRPGDRGRHNLHVYMRHWVAAWLKRERSPLSKRLPYSYSLGHALF